MNLADRISNLFGRKHNREVTNLRRIKASLSLRLDEVTALNVQTSLQMSQLLEDERREHEITAEDLAHSDTDSAMRHAITKDYIVQLKTKVGNRLTEQDESMQDVVDSLTAALETAKAVQESHKPNNWIDLLGKHDPLSAEDFDTLNALPCEVHRGHTCYCPPLFRSENHGQHKNRVG